MSGRSRVLATLVGLAGLVGCDRGGDERLPTELSVERLVLDLAATTAAVPPVRIATVQPGEPLRGAGPRAALIIPPGASHSFSIDAPAGSALRFEVGVDGAKDRTAAPDVRFEVRLDDTVAWTQVANPGRSRHDRRWFEGRLPLGATARHHTIELRTYADGPPDVAGTAGWSRVRVVEETQVARQPGRAGAPNLLVLLIDTCRADHLGVYGATPSPSPALDAFAAQALVFRHAVAQASWTLPSVATLMTGLHPHSHGALSDRPDRSGAMAGEYLHDRLDTWAEVAARAGISTVGVSANVLVSRATNLAQGFERFTEFGWDPTTKQWASADDVNAVFLRWQAAHPELRFAAYLHYMEPHDPYDPPADLRPSAPPGIRPAVAQGWIRDLANKVNWSKEGQLTATELDYTRALYAAEIRAWDRAFAGLLAALDARGLRENTTIVITADHGEEFQEHGHLTHGSHLYEETIAVPLLLAGPSIPSGVRDDLAQGIDLLPTIAAHLGLPLPPDLPGRDLLAGPHPTLAVSETARGIAADGGALSLVAGQDGRWKRIEAPTIGRAETFDLAVDPGETIDRPTDPNAARLVDALTRWRSAIRSPPPRTGSDPTLREKLKALGYLREE